MVSRMSVPTTNRQMANQPTVTYRPHWLQYVINELPLMLLFVAGLVYGGMDDMPMTKFALIFSGILFLILSYKYAYIRRIRYYIGAEQLISEYGVLHKRVDYLELYRIVDFQTNLSPMQQLFGLKTVIVLSMDRSTPRLEMKGMKVSDDVVGLIRSRVEYNKQRKGVYEITNR